jgi:excisionase family DNA binding protein
MRRHRRGSNEEDRSQFGPSIPEARERTTIPFAQRLTCTIDEACEATGLGRTKLYELIGAGRLATTTVGRRRLVIVRALQVLIDVNSSDAGDIKRIW